MDRQPFSSGAYSDSEEWVLLQNIAYLCSPERLSDQLCYSNTLCLEANVVGGLIGHCKLPQCI